MVRPANVARSRACSQCKKKRIKCDLRTPFCQRCIESNISCSGPLSGLFMVNANSSTFDSSPTKKPVKRRPITLTDPSHSASSSILYRAPSSGIVYEDALLTSFLSTFTTKLASYAWDTKLPRLKSAKNAAAMKAAANAVSLAFAAHSLNDVSMVATACRYYGESLRCHQHSFTTCRGRDICRKKAFNALPVTLLLSYFEMMQPTSADAWIRHIAAAERLFVLMGTDALQDDLLSQLYPGIRFNSVIRCFLTGSRTQLFDRPWSGLHIAHIQDCSTPLCHSLLELIARLSDQLVTSERQVDDLSLWSELVELDSLSIAFREEVGLDTCSLPWIIFDREPPTQQQSSSVLSEESISRVPLQLQDPRVCLTAAYFHAAAVLLLTLFLHAHPKRWSRENITQWASYHSLQILSCVKHLSSRGHSCSCLRMMLPIAVAHRYSPNAQHKVLANTIFRKWSASNGFSGLCNVTFGEDPTPFPTESFAAPARQILKEFDWHQGVA